jgi:Integrase core domain
MSERSSLCWPDWERAFYIGGHAVAAQVQNEIHVGKAATFPLKALISTSQRSVNDMAQIQYRLSRHGLFHLMMRLRHRSTAVLSFKTGSSNITDAIHSFMRAADSTTKRRPEVSAQRQRAEFLSKALLSWIVAQGIGTALIEPGKPWQNGVAESFNGKFRDQRGTSAFEPRLSHAERVRGSHATGPAGTSAASKGSRLKLTVVRRIWAGHQHTP